MSFIIRVIVLVVCAYAGSAVAEKQFANVPNPYAFAGK
jgi:hypothetical protein